MTEQGINWGPSGQTVYERTYSRKKPDGTNETWPETVHRVVNGNLALVYGDDVSKWSQDVRDEYKELVNHIETFKILPAGRHLWASGVKGRQFLMNCWTSGWDDKLSDHMEFTFMRLMEGGGVGSNYSGHHLEKYGLPKRQLQVHIVTDEGHPDYAEMADAGYLSSQYDADWDGAFEVEDSREGWAAALVDLIDTFYADEAKHENRVYDVSRVRGRGSRLKTFGGTASGPAPFAKMLLDVAEVLNGAAFAAVPRRILMGFDGSKSWDTLGWVDKPIETVPLMFETEGSRIYFPAAEIEDKGDGEFTITPHAVTPARTHLLGTEAMAIDHAIAECVVSGGNRRSARMSMMRWDDPQIFDFIECKQDGQAHYTTNISIEIDQEFIGYIQKAYAGQMYGEFGTYGRGAHALKVHEAAVQAMLTNGEPGYWNSTLSNHGEVQEIYCTNPCGEITLEEWEACNLGHINLDAFAPQTQGAVVDEVGLVKAHQLVTRFLIRATFADINDPKSREVQDRNRRIGVGHLGVQGFLVKQGMRYSEASYDGPHYGGSFSGLLQRLKSTVRNEARSYAFALRIPEPIKVTTVAPTGTVAKMPGVTEGIHPVLYRFFNRRIRFSKSDPDQAAQVERYRAEGFTIEDDIYDQSGMTAVVVIPTKELLVEQVESMGYPADIVETAYEIGLPDMLAFQAMYQTHYADNAVSFTVNVSATDSYSPRAAGEIIAKYLHELKGTTIFPDAGMAQSPYEEISELEYNLSLARSIEDSTDEDCATGACPIR